MSSLEIAHFLLGQKEQKEVNFPSGNWIASNGARVIMQKINYHIMPTHFHNLKCSVFVKAQKIDSFMMMYVTNGLLHSWFVLWSNQIELPATKLCMPPGRSTTRGAWSGDLVV